MEFFSFVQVTDMIMTANGDPFKEKLWISFLVGGICFAVLYAFKAAALFVIAKRNGYGKRWMAFVPFVNTYYIGVLADKNKFYNIKAKHISLGLAITEAVYVGLYILLYVAECQLFAGHYAEPKYDTTTVGGAIIDVLRGYKASPHLPESLEWAWWVFANLEQYILSWVNIIHLLLEILTMITFFQTYASNNYVLFSLFSVLFPISGILMFVVRKNKGKNYREFVMERQQRQYRAYQDYMRNNPQNPNNYNPYSGKPTPPQGGTADDPFGERSGSKPDDPFDGLGGSDGSSGDPFGDF